MSILSNLAFSVLSILPKTGSIAWYLGSLPSLALPAAESPSTKNISDFSGSLLEQSASLPGRVEVSVFLISLAASLALLAASLALLAFSILVKINFAIFLSLLRRS